MKSKIKTMKNLNGTVTISIKEFDDLRTFRNTIEKDGAIRLYVGYSGEEYFFFYSKDDGLKLAADLNESLYKELEELKKLPNLELEDIKKMSIWQFLKWRKK